MVSGNNSKKHKAIGGVVVCTYVCSFRTGVVCSSKSRIVSWIKRHCRRFFKNLFCPKSGKSNVYLVKVNRQPHLKLPFTTGGATFPSGEL
jgi:hypothetical protein